METQKYIFSGYKNFQDPAFLRWGKDDIFGCSRDQEHLSCLQAFEG